MNDTVSTLLTFLLVGTIVGISTLSCEDEEIRINPISRGNTPLFIDIQKIHAGAQVEVISRVKPVKFSGVSSCTYAENTIITDIESTGTIKFYF